MCLIYGYTIALLFTLTTEAIARVTLETVTSVRPKQVGTFGVRVTQSTQRTLIHIWNEEIHQIINLECLYIREYMFLFIMSHIIL